MIFESHPLYLLAGLFLFSLSSLVIHITLFGKSKKFNFILFSIIVGLYINTTVGLVLGIFHYFRGELILCLSLGLSFIAAKYFKKRKIRIPDSPDISFESVVVALAFTSLLVFYVYVTCFSKMPPDSMKCYLPWARIITKETYIPAEYLDNNRHYFIGLPPLLYVQVAFLFSVLGDFHTEIGYSLSLFYSFLTVFLVMNLYSGTKKLVPILSAFMLCSNLLFFEISAGVLQDGPLLFYTTASFYCLIKYIKENHSFYLTILAFSCALGALTKHTGMVLSLLFYVALIIAARKQTDLRKVTIIFFISHLPVVIWLMRNFILIGNPVFPLLNSFFKGKYYEFRLGPYPALIAGRVYSSSSVRRFATGFLSSSPLLAMSFYNIISHYKDRERRLFSFIFVAFCMSVIFMTRPNTRYIIPLFGVLSYYAGFGLFNIMTCSTWLHITFTRLLDKTLLFMNKNKYACILILFGFNVVVTAVPCTVEDGEWGIMEYLEEHEETKDFVIFGVGSKVLIWYGEYTVLQPEDYAFRVLNEGHLPRDRDSTYYYELFQKLNMRYVYDDPYGPIDEEKYQQLREVLKRIEEDEVHFQLVYEGDGKRLWKVREPG